MFVTGHVIDCRFDSIGHGNDGGSVAVGVWGWGERDM